jgi:two-component system, OmpR family, alkaline phosphatase synthesis response regulator PhoP
MIDSMHTAPKILIIEDEKTLARALELKLSLSGFAVTTVFNGKDGLTLALKESFEVILLDLIMPGMDGFAVLTTLKEENIMTPVMVLSNLSQESDMRRINELGAKGFFIKSNTPIATIVEQVTKLLNNSPLV